MKQHKLHQSLNEEFPEGKFVTTIDFRSRKFIVKSGLKTSWTYEIDYLPFAEISEDELIKVVGRSYSAA